MSIKNIVRDYIHDYIREYNGKTLLAIIFLCGTLVWYLMSNFFLETQSKYFSMGWEYLCSIVNRPFLLRTWGGGVYSTDYTLDVYRDKKHQYIT